MREKQVIFLRELIRRTVDKRGNKRFFLTKGLIYGAFVWFFSYGGLCSSYADKIKSNSEIAGGDYHFPPASSGFWVGIRGLCPKI